MFVPTLQELLESLGRTIETSVVPAVSDPFARSQALEVSAQLRAMATKWRDIGYWAEIECSEMRGALEDGGALLDRFSAKTKLDLVTSLRQDVSRALAATFEPDQATRSPVSFGAEAAVLAAAMERTILVLHQLQNDYPGDELLSKTRETLRNIIRKQADRRDPKLDNATVSHNN